ncbi:hypothetical protein FOZ61_002806 [Perkinsus olseni]|uniref:Uncharacterized protein n=1 Tax=Perkinsus olseni TaxID=32597 RepID=A0A7J6LT15_PEROL|nr:hypothetical protein FOZ61_002806 [Perkinsus olseni]KAF4667327.1 hypothetical protein FOL46_002589 [Perkinsus olseni]
MLQAELSKPNDDSSVSGRIREEEDDEGTTPKAVDGISVTKDTLRSQFLAASQERAPDMLLTLEGRTITLLRLSPPAMTSQVLEFAGSFGGAADVVALAIEGAWDQSPVTTILNFLFQGASNPEVTEGRPTWNEEQLLTFLRDHA